MSKNSLSLVHRESLEIGGGIDPNYDGGMLRHVLLDPDFDELSQ